MARRCLIALVVVGSFAASLIASVPPDETDRLARLARVWAAVKYLHPFMVQRPIDWDGALVRAIPKVRAAETDEDVASAVGSMDEA